VDINIYILNFVKIKFIIVYIIIFTGKDSSGSTTHGTEEWSVGWAYILLKKYLYY